MKRAIGMLVLAASLLANATAAQEVRVQVGRGPHYLGQPIEIQVVASDFEDDPTPEVEAPEVDGGSLRYAGVSDSSSTSITIINGRMNRVREVNFIYRFQLHATREGQIRVPPFRISQGTTTRSTQPISFEIKSVPTTGLVELSLELPEGPIFVGQKVPLEVVLRIDREAQRDLLAYHAVVPLFDLPTLRFLDDPMPDSDTQLEVETAAGTLRLPASSREVREGGRTLLEVRAQRTMIPLANESIEAEAPRVVITRGTRFRRDLFNQRQATASQRLMSQGEPVTLEVIEVPRKGRPPSFAGAVGSGFSLEVSADRSVVQLGEPILLELHLRGDGDLSTASLPPLDAAGLFDPEQFRLPEESPPGIVDDDGKHFEVSLRVLDADVREIPALAYSWFDAESRAFETTHSRPIALSVGAAQVIGAEDVARRVGDDESDAAIDALGNGRADGDSAARVDTDRVDRGTSLVMSGANLAIDSDPERVLRPRARPSDAPLLVAAGYGVGLALLVFAFFDQRRRTRDPESLARDRAFASAERDVEAALRRDGDEAAGALGRALRELVAARPELADPEFDALLAECDALRFAPSGGGGCLPEALASRARDFVASRRRAGAAAPGASAGGENGSSQTGQIS